MQCTMKKIFGTLRFLWVHCLRIFAWVCDKNVLAKAIEEFFRRTVF